MKHIKDSDSFGELLVAYTVAAGKDPRHTGASDRFDVLEMAVKRMLELLRDELDPDTHA